MREKNVVGTCKLCFKETNLTFEHVPPQSCYNQKTRYYVIDSHDYFVNPNDYKKGRIHQGGTGGNYYCKDCNNTLGNRYVNDYKLWVDCGITMIKNYEVGNVYEIREIKPLNILKLICSFFLSLNRIDSIISNSIRGFITNHESQYLDDNVFIYTYLNEIGDIRVCSEMVLGNLREIDSSVVSEFAFPPFGYVVSNKPLKNISFCEITKFKEYKADYKVDGILMSIPKYETHLPFPLDYRTRDQINIDDKQNFEK